MNLKYVFLLLFLTGFTVVYSQQQAAVDMAKSNYCQCYCSDLCGPRDRKEDDTPFFDTEYGQCFCKQRDKDNYIPHGCNLKPKQEFEFNCCKMK